MVLDPHKTMFIPYGCGVVLVRNVEWLLNSFSHKAAYMQDSFEMDDINAADVSPELTKHFRALRMWLPMHLHGLKPFRANLEEKLLLTSYFQQEVAKLGFETGPEPQLSVAIFRYPGGNEVNQRIIDGIHRDGRVFMSSTSIDGELWIRCCVVAHRTHLREINIALEMLEDIVETLEKS